MSPASLRFGLLFVASIGCGHVIDQDLDRDGVLAWRDCDDANAEIGEPSPEICNGLDDDCDGEVDEDAVGEDVISPDLDGDGFGEAGQYETSCGVPVGYADNALDCDDDDPDVHPEAIERCNGIDDNCDHIIDEPAAVDARTWFPDLDGDGFGGDDAQRACTPPRDHILLNGDCDDYVFIINPNAAERCNQIDDDCDGVIDEGCRG